MVATSVREDLERDLECLDLLGCMHGLNERDQVVFQLLQQAEGVLPSTTSQIEWIVNVRLRIVRYLGSLRPAW